MVFLWSLRNDVYELGFGWADGLDWDLDFRFDTIMIPGFRAFLFPTSVVRHSFDDTIDTISPKAVRPCVIPCTPGSLPLSPSLWVRSSRLLNRCAQPRVRLGALFTHTLAVGVYMYTKHYHRFIKSSQGA